MISSASRLPSPCQVSWKASWEPQPWALSTHSVQPSRAENSNTPRHLAELRMVEPEVAFLDMDGLMELEEDFIKYCIRWALEHCKDDLAFLNKMIDKGLIARLEARLEFRLRTSPIY